MALLAGCAAPQGGPPWPRPTDLAARAQDAGLHDVWGQRLAGILLTGANDDGADGLARIGEQGGLTIVQDPDEAAVSTMPQAAIARRTPDHVLGLAGIHALLLELDKH